MSQEIANKDRFEEAVTVLFNQLGAAHGQLIYTDGRVEIKSVRTALRDSRCGVALCGVSDEAYAAAREILGWHRFNGETYLGDSDLVKIERVAELNDKGATLEGIIPEGARFCRITLTRSVNEAPESVTFYVVVGTPRPARGDRPVSKDSSHRAPSSDTTVRGNRPVLKDPRGILNDLVHQDDAPAGKPGKPFRKGGGKKDRRDRDDSRYN